MDIDNGTYKRLFELVNDKDYFVISTNVDHQFQKAGFDKEKLFYTQGDYGLFQCSEPCHDQTYDNEAMVKNMIEFQEDMKIPTELIPKCPKCGKPMTMNLRSDDKFVEDEGWHRVAERYDNFLRKHEGQHILFLKLALCFECKAHFMSIGYAVIVARAIIPIWTCVERITGVPIDYSLMTNIFV